MTPPLKKTARAVSFSGADPVATIISVQGTRTGGKHLVHIFFTVHGSCIHQPGICQMTASIHWNFSTSW